VIQIIVYAGAIMVLFLFVVMLLNVPQEDEPGEHIVPIAPGARRLGAILAAAVIVELGWALTRQTNDLASLGGGPRPTVPTVREIGMTLFGPYAFAFEVTSILILVAMLGAIVLAHRPGTES
jgi:NADH-quinone oxidoreductase subunit J